jgi:hypothetical protein
MRKSIWMKGLACGIIFLFIGTIVVSSTITNPPLPASTISISGTIYGLPLDGTGPVPVKDAQVAIIGGKIIGGITFALEKSIPTNANGYYSFSDIPIGLFFVLARKPGAYLPSFRLVRLTSSLPVKQNQDINMIRIGGGNTSQIQIMTTLLPGSFEGSIGPRPHGNQTVGNISGTYAARNRGGRFNGEWEISIQNTSKSGTMRGAFMRIFILGRATIDGVNRTIPIVGFMRSTNGTFVGRFMAPVGPALYFWGTYT